MIISDTTSRKHLSYLCKKELGKLKAGDELSEEEENSRSMLLSRAIDDQPPAMQGCLNLFIFRNVPATLQRALSSFLLLLAGDAALSSCLPFCSHHLVREIIDLLLARSPANSQLQKLKDFSPELSCAFVVAEVDGFLTMFCDFVLFLLEKVEAIHADNRPTQPAIPIPGSYNPPSGVAYYFTEEGHQVRRLGQYDISGSGKKNYDDLPQVDEVCNKDFPIVSRGGFGYMFLWFCPLHGHCYGLHLIKGGEGRKDPFASLFKYLPEPPEHVFFDFACQLNEYCLNREPDFFKTTRFWHDIFHSFPHKCGPNFRSARVLGLEGVNSEICEQWNAFLQCIKFTASHLSQSHMMFFLQFMISLFNKKKTKRFRAKAQVAIAGLL